MNSEAYQRLRVMRQKPKIASRQRESGRVIELKLSPAELTAWRAKLIDDQRRDRGLAIEAKLIHDLLCGTEK